jgi:hypothetical protein
MPQPGNHKIPVYIEYMHKGRKISLQKFYKQKVVKSDSNTVRQFYYYNTHVIPAYKSQTGQVLPVAFKGDTHNADIHQNGSTIYITPKKLKHYSLDVYHRGRKIDKVKFMVKRLHPPKMHPAIRQSSPFNFNRPIPARTRFPMLLRESDLAQRMTGTRRQFLVKTLKVTQYRANKAIATKTVNEELYRASDLFDCQRGDRFIVKVTKAVHVVSNTVEVPLNAVTSVFKHSVR